MKLINPSGKKNLIVGKNELLNIHLEDFETGSRDFDLIINLVGENAECHVQGRAQTHGTDSKSWKVKQVFKGKNQLGRIDLRGTAEDQSFLAFDGAGNLTEKSDNADANIEEKIILFDQAKGRSLPVLRVETDKVKSAGHGASIAPIDKEKILYFQSRGVCKKEAENILKEGFLKF